MHFTYEENIDEKSLHQGDLLKRTDELVAVLENFHKHYVRPDYRYFSILTQTCDLVRRIDDVTPAPGECKARYITIAAVRSLDTVKARAVEERQTSLDRKLNIISQKEKSKCDLFFESLLNNNVQEYFYYFGKPGSIPNEEVCAFLRLSVAVRATDHYDVLLRAKVLQLKEGFQHKLGFHVGSIYSRIGTEDWEMDESAFKKMASGYTKMTGTSPLWVDGKLYDKVIGVMKKLPPDEQNEDRVNSEIQNRTKSSDDKRTAVLKLITDELGKLNCPVDIISKVELRVLSNPDFRNLVK